MNVNVPVELLCEGCLRCADLRIQDDGLYLSTPGQKVLEMTHSFSCANLDRCLVVKNALEREMKKQQ